MKPSEKNLTDLHERIQMSIEASERSYADLARETGVNPGQVSRICRGEFRTFSHNLVQICTALGVSITTQPEAIDPAEIRSDPSWMKLQRSLRRAWDKTPEGAEKLARVITAVAAVGKR